MVPDSETLEDRIKDFTAYHLGVKREKLSPDTSLNDELGMAGEDAVEFFDDFGVEFKVDLDDLHIRWDQHFVPEGGLSYSFLVILTLCIVSGAGLRGLIGLLPSWAWSIALIGIVILVHNSWFAEKLIPVTMADLVDSARSGRWIKSYKS